MFSLKIHHSNQGLTVLFSGSERAHACHHLEFILPSSIQRSITHSPSLLPPSALLREGVYCLRAGVFLSGGNVTGRKTAWMVPMSPPSARSATAGWDSSSARTATAPARTSCVTRTTIALMGPMKTLLFVVCWIALCLLCHFHSCFCTIVILWGFSECHKPRAGPKS